MGTAHGRDKENRIIQSLTPSQRQVLAAVYFDGKLEREVADDMGISRPVVAKHLAAALKKVAPYAERLSARKKRIIIRPIQLSLCDGL